MERQRTRDVKGGDGAWRSLRWFEDVAVAAAAAVTASAVVLVSVGVVMLVIMVVLAVTGAVVA